MDDITKILQKELLKKYDNIFRTLIFMCGGVMFQTHFYQLLGRKDAGLLQKMIENKLVKIKRIGKNQVVIAKYAAYCHYNLDNKNSKVTGNRLLHSALICEMILHTYKMPFNAERFLQQSNFSYFKPRCSFDLLNSVYTYCSDKREYDLTSLSYALKELEEKVMFIECSKKGRKDKLEQRAYKGDDLLTLKSNDVFIKEITYSANVDTGKNEFKILLSIFAIGKATDKIAGAIKKAEVAFVDMLHGIDTSLCFDIYSLTDRKATVESAIYSALIKGNPLQEDYYKNNINFHWYACKNRLFSGIDIEKWL